VDEAFVRGEEPVAVGEEGARVPAVAPEPARGEDLLLVLEPGGHEGQHGNEPLALSVQHEGHAPFHER
jgi:hypothetical protein